MCGITGIFEFDGLTTVDHTTIEAMNQVIIYRGPDDGGAVVGQGYGMGARRLSIMDLSPLGHMPMKSDDGRYYIVFNGEVYNFKEVRETLEKKGISFRTGTDTEVILKSYIHFGADCLNMFNGMFAFAIYDTEKKETFIARDRLGVKPLFYCIYKNKLVIGSELKCLWEAGVPKKFNASKFGELFSFRYVAGEETVYQDVKKLMPGHYMTLANKTLEFHQWWDLKTYALNPAYEPKGDVNKWYQETFDDSVRLRKISDVPVGVLLSGGLDSSSVAASMAKLSADHLSSFTVRFTEGNYDEGDLAAIVAQKYGLDFNEFYLDPKDVFQKTIEVLEKNDEPIFHASDLFVKEISGYARSKVTVLLSGEGGDETLGGYVRYNPLRYVNLLNLGFAFRFFLSLLPIRQYRVKKLIKMLSIKTVENFILYNSSEILPDDVQRLGMKGEVDY